MRLFIQIKNGLPFEHPIVEENFVQAFPNIDINNLPSEFANFERIERPKYGPYEVYEGCSYEWQGDIVKDVHHIRQMSLDEKNELDAIADPSITIEQAWELMGTAPLTKD